MRWWWVVLGCGGVWCGVVLRCAGVLACCCGGVLSVCCGLVARCGVVWCGVVWCGRVWCGLVWSGLVWSGLVRWFGGLVVWWCGGVVVWWWWCGVPGGRLNAGGSPVWPEDRRNRNGSSMPFSGLVAKRCAPYRLANGAARPVSGDYFCLTRPPPELLRPGGLGWWSPQLQTARPLLEETLVQALPQDTPLPDLPLVGCWHEGFSGCPNWGVTVQALWLVLSVLALGPDGCRSPGCNAPAYTLTARL